MKSSYSKIVYAILSELLTMAVQPSKVLRQLVKDISFKKAPKSYYE